MNFISEVKKGGAYSQETPNSVSALGFDLHSEGQDAALIRTHRHNSKSPLYCLIGG
jgi:hypothetical protein